MLLLYALAMLQIAVFLVTTYVMGRAVGARVGAVNFGMPAVLRLRRANPEIRIGPVPHGSVDFAPPPGTDFFDGLTPLSRTARLAVTLAPWLLLLAIAIVCLGAEPALRTFARGFVQFVFTLDVTPLVRRMVEIARTGPVAITAGILFAKVVAVNLLPFTGHAGGAVIRAFVVRDGVLPPAFERFMAIPTLVWYVWTIARFGWAFVQVARG